MKSKLIQFLFLNLATIVSAQNTDENWSKALDEENKWSDNLPEQLYIKNIGKPEIKYQYLDTDSIQYIQRNWTENDNGTQTQVSQSFFLKNNQLITASERLIWIFNKMDSAIWAANYHFENGKLVNLESLGHGKSEDDNWNPQTEVLENLHTTLYDIDKHRFVYLAKQDHLNFDWDNDGKNDEIQWIKTKKGFKIAYYFSEKISNYETQELTTQPHEIFFTLSRTSGDVFMHFSWENYFQTYTIAFDPDLHDFKITRLQSTQLAKEEQDDDRESDYDLVSGKYLAELHFYDNEKQQPIDLPLIHKTLTIKAYPLKDFDDLEYENLQNIDNEIFIKSKEDYYLNSH